MFARKFQKNGTRAAFLNKSLTSLSSLMPNTPKVNMFRDYAFRNLKVMNPVIMIIGRATRM